MSDDNKFQLPFSKKKMDDMTVKEFEKYITEIKDHMSWLISGYDNKKFGDQPEGDLRGYIKNEFDDEETIKNKFEELKKDALQKLYKIESEQKARQDATEKSEKLQQELEKKERTIEEKSLEIIRLKSEGETIKKQAKEFFEEATERAKEKDNKIGSLETRLEIAKENAKENGDKLAEKEQQLAVEEKKSHELSIELRGKERELGNVKEEAKATNDTQVEKIAKLDQKIQQLNEDITSLDKKIKNTNEELENTQRALSSTERKLSSANDTIEAKEKENTSLSRSLERKETDLEKVTKESENFASKMNKTYGGVEDLVSPYVDVANEILSCDSTKEILEKYLPIEEVDNQILFIRHVGRGEGLAQEIYNTMRRYKAINKEPLNSAEEKMIRALNKFYQENDHLEFDILHIPKSDQNFEKKFVQDLEKPANVSFLKYTDVYVPAVMKDEKNVTFKAYVKGKS